MNHSFLGRHTLLAATLLGGALAVGACGGDDDHVHVNDHVHPATGGSANVGTGGTGVGGTGAGVGGTGVGGTGVGGTGVGGTGVGGTGVGGTGVGGTGVGGDNMGGGAGAGNTDPCDVMGDVPDNNVKARSDTAEDWDDNDFDSVVASEECGVHSYVVTWPHEADFLDDDPAEANSEVTQFELEFPTTEDLTGMTLTMEIALAEEVRGATAENGGYDINLGATDASDYTEFVTTYDDGNSGELFAAGETVTLTLAIPSDVADFDPMDIIKLVVRINTKFWGDGSGVDADNPIFAYETSTFDIVSLTVTPTP